VKQIISISLGPSSGDYEFDTEFLGQDFNIKRFGTDGDIDKTVEMLLRWEKRADAIGLGGMKFPDVIASRGSTGKHTEQFDMLSSRIQTPVTMGRALRNVAYEWSLRHIEFEFGNYFSNARVLFLSGMSNYGIAKVMSEFTDNLSFASF